MNWHVLLAVVCLTVLVSPAVITTTAATPSNTTTGSNNSTSPPPSNTTAGSNTSTSPPPSTAGSNNSTSPPPSNTTAGSNTSALPPPSTAGSNTSTSATTSNTTAGSNTSTSATTTASTTTATATTTVSPATAFRLVFRILGTFVSALSDPNSQEFKAQANNITSEVGPIYRRKFPSFILIKIIGFTSGSIVANSTVEFSSGNITVTDVRDTFVNGLSNLTFTVDPASINITQTVGNSTPAVIASSVSMICLSLLSLLLSFALHF